MIPAPRTPADNPATDAERALCQRCEIHLGLDDDALDAFAQASAANRAAVDRHIAGLMDGLIDDADHGARIAEIVATARGDENAAFQTAVARRLRYIRGVLDPAKEPAR